MENFNNTSTPTKGGSKAIGILLTLVGIVFLSVGLIFTVASIATSDGDSVFIFMTVCSLIVAVIGLVAGLTGMKKLQQSNNPNFNELSDEMSGTLIYEDKFISISDQYLYTKRGKKEIVPLDEILWVYEARTRYNFLITVGRTLNIKTATLSLKTNVLFMSKKHAQSLLSILNQVCPNAAMGYSSESIAYYNSQKDERKR